MKDISLLLLAILANTAIYSQELPASTEEALEAKATATEETTGDDDEMLQQEAWFKQHPIDLNHCSAEELSQLALLSEVQVRQFFDYLNAFGQLVDIYELQAVPGWDIPTIRSILPYIMIDQQAVNAVPLMIRWHGGNQRLQLRSNFVPEKAKGYRRIADSVAAPYTGSRYGLLVRYTYNFKNLLRWGLLGKKDPGEPFFRGHQAAGFDFYSFHLFIRKAGLVKAFAAGDFTFNLAQGLINWQTMAFAKSADALAIKRLAPVVKPYTSSGEYNFYRGIAITMGRKSWEHSVFVSYRKLDGGATIDSAGNSSGTSINSSGLHRTISENVHRGETTLYSAGFRLQWQLHGLRWGINSVAHRFSANPGKWDQPYQLFADRGKTWLNAGMDASYTWRNLHLFSEIAADRRGNAAILAGTVVSLTPGISCSMLYRNMANGYHSLFADAFTANSTVGNENAFYMGLHAQLSPRSSLDAWADVFRFPWLRYRSDAPAGGSDVLVRWMYSPVKTTSLSILYKRKFRQQNIAGVAGVYPQTNQQLRLQLTMTVSKRFTLLGRSEWVHNTKPGDGYLLLTDWWYNDLRKKWKGLVRLQYFETDGFDERIYAPEHMLPLSYAVPFYYGRGFYCILSCNHTIPCRLNKGSSLFSSVEAGASGGVQVNTDGRQIGSGNDLLPGQTRIHFRLQVLLNR